MKKFLIFTGVFFSVLSIRAQELPNRYLEEIFETVNITKDVVFSTNIPTIRTTNLFGNQIANEVSYGERTVTLEMNIYKPAGDEFSNRPVLIFAFGGGFVNGNREEKRILSLCETFAKRGFVTATIDYRLGMQLNNPELSKRAVYRALQDGRSAVRYFRKNAANLSIDPNQIYLSGHSAGALLAYHNVYLDKDFERPASTRAYFGRPDLGGLDDIGDNRFYDDGSPISGKANGAMGFAGALGELSYIEGVNDVAGVYYHSTDDNTVPYGSGTPFSALNWIPGINLPTVHGSSVMSLRARQVSANNEFFSYTNRGHSVHANGSNLYPDIAPSGAQFFVNQYLGPQTSPLIKGDVTFCTNCEPKTYNLSDTSAYFYEWQVTGGSIINNDISLNEVTVLWDNNAVNRSIAVTPYSPYLARGITNKLFAGSDNCAWDLKPGLANDIGAGGGETFVVGTNNRIYEWADNNWSILPGKARRIDVGEDGVPFIIGTNGGIYKFTNNSWSRLRGSASDIGVNKSHVYVSGGNNIIYRLQNNRRWASASGGRAIRVDVASNGDAWVVGEDNYVYIVRNDVFLPRRGNFKASDITVSSKTDTIWAVELGTGIPHKYVGGGEWEPFIGILTNITVSENGVLWGVNNTNDIWSNDCFVTSNTSRELSTKQVLENSTDVVLYPNPVNSILNIKMNSVNKDIVKVTLIDFHGAELYSNNKVINNNLSIDVSSFSNGFYVLKLERKNLEPIYKRIIVK